jgi:hypothetical protein
MRMPIVSYFIVMGTLLGGVLLWISNTIEPDASGLQASQIVGVPKFKAEPETAHATVTAVNFAAEYALPATKQGKVVQTAPKPRKRIDYSARSKRNQLAEFPSGSLSIQFEGPAPAMPPN